MPLICQLCNQRPATTHVTELGPDGARQELHLCPECIREHQLDLAAGPPPLAALAGAATAQEAAAPTAETAAPPALCPTCGLAFDEYASNNLFGCPDCFAAFDRQVAELVQRYHGALRHAGRVPAGAAVAPQPAKPRRRAPRRDQRAELERRLAEAVAAERYEEAASLRDALRKAGGGA